MYIIKFGGESYICREQITTYDELVSYIVEAFTLIDPLESYRIYVKRCCLSKFKEVDFSDKCGTIYKIRLINYLGQRLDFSVTKIGSCPLCFLCNDY